MTVEQLIEKLKEFPAWRDVKIGNRWVESVVETDTYDGPVVTFVIR